MVNPPKRWQLLLVADDGRMIPFRRIKGVALMLVLLLLLLALICAGLAWRLTAEQAGHRQTRTQLVETGHRMDQFQSKHELVAAELVLALAQLEQAGLAAPSALEQAAHPPDPDSAPAEAVAALSPDDVRVGIGSPPADDRTGVVDSAETPIGIPTQPTSGFPGAEERALADAAPEKTAEPEPAVIAVTNWQLRHNREKQTLEARFQVRNLGPRSAPVAGRCVVVFKNDPDDASAWLVMPQTTLVNGEPDGGRGQPFRIVNYREMRITSVGLTDPSIYKTATLYVFDDAGEKILHQAFDLDWPALES